MVQSDDPPGEEYLGEGPFRWLVYESQEGDLLAVSEAFSMPSRGGEVLFVEVTPSPCHPFTLSSCHPVTLSG
jgi:hypothetical protein